MKIIVDAMGADNSSAEIVKGALLASDEFGVDIILVGKEAEISSAVPDDKRDRVEIVNADDVITMEDDPTNAARFKKDSSMVTALRLLKDGAGDALVSAGNTGALLAGGTLYVKRIRVIRRAALSPILPTENGKALLIDCGANVECTPEYLLQFAFMGSYYMQSVFGVKNPVVRLLNNGAEEHKGGELQKQAYRLLKKAADDGKINFCGNIEARDVMFGKADVIVTDGFSGNILLKGIEGLGSYFGTELKAMFTKSIFTKIAALMVAKGIKNFKKKMDYHETGGAPLLGVSKPIIKAHGSSKAYTIRSAIKQAIDFTDSHITESIAENIEYMILPEETEQNG